MLFLSCFTVLSVYNLHSSYSCMHFTQVSSFHHFSDYHLMQLVVEFQQQKHHQNMSQNVSVSFNVTPNISEDAGQEHNELTFNIFIYYSALV